MMPRNTTISNVRPHPCNLRLWRSLVRLVNANKNYSKETHSCPTANSNQCRASAPPTSAVSGISLSAHETLHGGIRLIWQRRTGAFEARQQEQARQVQRFRANPLAEQLTKDGRHQIRKRIDLFARRNDSTTTATPTHCAHVHGSRHRTSFSSAVPPNNREKTRIA